MSDKIRRPSIQWTLAACLLLSCASLLPAQRLIDEEPYDLLTVVDEGGETELKVLPLDLPGRRVPRSPRPNDTIKVRLVSNPDEEFLVSWSSIKKVELFEQRILAEAARFIREKKYDDAFEYLAFLKEKYPKTPGLEEGMQRMLTAEASDLFRAKKYERAWFLLNEIYAMNPGRPGLDRALRAVLDRLLSQRVADRDFLDARRILEVANKQYGRSQSELIAKWSQRLENYARQAKRKAEEHLAKKEFDAAYRAGQLMMEIWPDTEGARELFAQLAKSYPIVTVAVTQPFAPATTSATNARSVRRAQRLLLRRLFELVDVGSEGGRYECPLGTYQVTPDGRTIRIDLTALRNAKAEISGLTVARRLREFANPMSSSFVPDWWDVLKLVRVDDLFKVVIELNRPHLRFEPLVADALTPVAAAQTVLAPYVPLPSRTGAESDRPEQRFRVNSDYLLGTDQQPREVTERLFDSSTAALNALRRGEVDLVARLLPAEAAQAMRDDAISTVRYRIPSTHVLIPNYDDTAARDRAFRVALLYAIDRETILNRELLGGSEVDGCQVVSGPFPRGFSIDDPISYGYNRQIDPRPYDPRLAKVRLAIAEIQASTAAEKAGTEPPDFSKVILAHPDDEIPRIACEHIANNWRILGLNVEVIVMKPGQSVPDGPWHFVYADLRMAEPLNDAVRLLSSDGFARCSSPYLNLALRQLQQSDNWNQAGQRLRNVHQICFDDASVLPLWQLADYMAIRSRVEGVGTDPVTLYQNIEQWRLVVE